MEKTKYLVAGLMRYWLIQTDYARIISNRVEVSTPLNSWRRLVEGVHLYEQGIDPYFGDVFHETPIMLVIFHRIINMAPWILPFLFTICDVATGYLLFLTAEKFMSILKQRQEEDLKSYAADSKHMLLRATDFKSAPVYVASAYLFNPYTILSCVGLTTTVFNNFFMAIALHSMVNGRRVLSCMSIAFATHQALYPVTMIVPATIFISNAKGGCAKCSYFRTLLLFGIFWMFLLYLSALIMDGSFNYLDNTYGFIFLSQQWIYVFRSISETLYVLHFMMRRVRQLTRNKAKQCLQNAPKTNITTKIKKNTKDISIALEILKKEVESKTHNSQSQFTSTVMKKTGSRLTVPDLKPNIGLFWYFFTEMFEHFRLLFVCALQINALVLYVIPLTVRFRHEPMLLATTLITLAAIFRSYPCIGDVAFYMALFPLWRHLFPYMQQRFIIFCFMVATSVLGPVMWHLWIYSRSGNANFFFGVTLAFATAQIFFLIDFLFAYIKREYTLIHGTSKTVNGAPAKLVLL